MQYTCCICGTTFSSSLEHMEEAAADYKKHFPDANEETEVGVCCEPCYEEYMRKAEAFKARRH